MSSLTSVRLRNYRCFLDHTVDFGPTTVVVGKNNAGKSTLIEALRLVSLGLAKFRNPVARPAPEWLEDIAPGYGQRIDASRLGNLSSTLFYHYGDPPAVIDARFSDNSELTIYIGPDGEGHAVFSASDGSTVRNRRDARDTKLPHVGILPQITPLEKEEKVLVADYVRQHLDSHLAPRHFRNQLNLLRDEFFPKFCELVEDSWHSVRVENLGRRGGQQGDSLQLMIRDGGFVAEVGWMGHGLQMWLQTLWFITRSSNSGALVLDEPDVYMHPDLQRRLIRFLKRQQSQLIVATHSTEILAEVDATDVLVLDRGRQRSSFAVDLPAVQRLIEGMGSAQNLQIARLWRSRALVLVEGEDMKILKRVHDLVCPDSASSLDALPNWSIGGWTGWSNALGSAVALKNSVHKDIKCYCIFDSDYHLEPQIEERREQAASAGIELHVLERKEIENYFLSPALIRRALDRSARAPTILPDEDEIGKKIDEMALELLVDVQDCFSVEFLNSERSAGIKVANQRAREVIKSRSNTLEERLAVVPGKTMLTRLSDWCKKTYGVSFGVATILRVMRRDDIPKELAQVVSAISNGDRFPIRTRKCG